VKERLLLDGIALNAANVAPGNIQLAAAIVTDLADSWLPVWNRAAMATSIAAYAIAVIDLLVQIAFSDLLIDDVFERGQQTPLRLF